MAINAISIPAQTVKMSKIVVDSDLDLGAYSLLATQVRASQIMAEYLDELVVSAGVHVGLGSDGIISVDNSLDCSGALSGSAFAGFMQRKYTGNSGTEIYEIFIPGTIYAVWTGTTKTTSGVRIRIPDTGTPAANLKLKALIKTANGSYGGNVGIYKNGIEQSITATTNSVTPVWVNFSATIAVAAGDYLDFYLYNNNASTATTLYAIAVIGDVTTAGGLINESETPQGVT